jgi:hypothetical protein
LAISGNALYRGIPSTSDAEGAMTKREEIIDQIISLETRKFNLARTALEHEAAGRYDKADQCDAWWNAASDEIGRLHAQLREREIEEGYVGLSEFVADNARSL